MTSTPGQERKEETKEELAEEVDEKGLTESAKAVAWVVALSTRSSFALITWANTCAILPSASAARCASGERGG